MKYKELISNYSQSRGVIAIKSEAISRVVPDQSLEEGLDEDPLEIGPSPHQDCPLFGAWHEFLATTGPYSHMWTHSYIHPYGDRKAIDALWDCTRHINRSIWGPRWNKKNNGIHATVIAERHKLSLELRGRLHFHVLVQPSDSGVSDERFGAVVHEAAQWLKDDYKRSMSANDRTDVRKIYDTEGLAKYLTKDLHIPHLSNGENIFFIRPNGIDGLVLPLKSNAELNSHH